MKLSQVLLAMVGFSASNALPKSSYQPMIPHDKPSGSDLTRPDEFDLTKDLLWGCVCRDEAHTGQCCPWLDSDGGKPEAGPLPAMHPRGCKIKEWSQPMIEGEDWGEQVYSIQGMCCPNWAMSTYQPMVEGKGVYGETG